MHIAFQPGSPNTLWEGRNNLDYVSVDRLIGSDEVFVKLIDNDSIGGVRAVLYFDNEADYLKYKSSMFY